MVYSICMDRRKAFFFPCVRCESTCDRWLQLKKCARRQAECSAAARRGRPGDTGCPGMSAFFAPCGRNNLKTQTGKRPENPIAEGDRVKPPALPVEKGEVILFG